MEILDLIHDAQMYASCMNMMNAVSHYVLVMKHNTSNQVIEH